MSVPKNLRDELLSAFLDGEVTADERARVEQLLQSDDDARNQYERLLKMRSGFSAFPKQVKLPDDFASRVLQAAFDEAKREGLSLEHPLRIAAERGLGAAASTRPVGWRRWGWSALAASIAASGLLGAVLLSRSIDEGQVAKSPSGSDGPSSLVVTPNDVPTNPSASTVLAQEVPAPNKDSLRDDTSKENVPVPVAPVSAPMIATNANGQSGSADSQARPEKEIQKAIPQKIPLVMLVEIRLKKSETDTNPVATVLERAGIGKIRDVKVEQAIVDQLAAAKVVRNAPPAEEADADSMQIVVVQAMARKIDRTIVEFYSGAEGISSVGLNLALDNKLMRAAQHVAGMSPVEVKHQDKIVASRLVGGDSQSKWFRAAENGRKFTTDKSNLSLTAMSNSTDEKDIPAAMILMVRYE